MVEADGPERQDAPAPIRTFGVAALLGKAWRHATNQGTSIARFFGPATIGASHWEPARPLQRSLGPSGLEMPKKSPKCLPKPPAPAARLQLQLQNQ